MYSPRRHVALISEAKKPGDIEDETGNGNEAFNAGVMKKFAYEIYELYALREPIKYFHFRTECRGRPPIGWQFARTPLVTKALIGDMERIF